MIQPLYNTFIQYPTEIMKTIVVSAVNLNVGGTLAILRDCLSYLSELAAQGEYRIVAIVHDRQLVPYDNIEYIELKWPKKRWIYRLWCEYVYMKELSRKLSPVYLWLSLHDTTPTVKAERRAVYCHNSFPFYDWKWSELFVNYRIVMFAWFTKYFYRKNIHRNRYVVVQQQWMKDAFKKMFRLPTGNLIVAPPEKTIPAYSIAEVTGSDAPQPCYRFIYASSSDIHKNYELLCEAARLAEQQTGKDAFKVILTIKGDENKYTRQLYKQWGHVHSVDFAGYMSRDTLFANYRTSDCLVFPSRIETWGLPISEFMAFDKPMILADLPYTHETASGARRACFVNTGKPQELADIMVRLIQGDESDMKPVPVLQPEPPVARSWKTLFDILLQ